LIFRAASLAVGHAVDPELVEGAAITESEFATRLGLPAAPALAEAIMVERDIRLVELTGARYHFGQISTRAALDAIIPRAKEDGIAIAAIRNTNHLGALAYYAEHVAGLGLTCIALTISEALVHPWGGRKAMIGTNPIAIGVPADPTPMVLDMATGLVSMGKIHDHANRGAPIPLGWALDEKGDPTTDASAAKKGAIAPFGGPKGYALGIAFEVLVASLAASAIGITRNPSITASIPFVGSISVMMTSAPCPLARIATPRPHQP